MRLTAAEFQATADKARSNPEALIHKAILEWLRLTYPRAVIHHSPNEIGMAGSDEARGREKRRRAAMGTLPGFPDLIMIHAGRVYAFEVKAPKNYPDDAQKAVGEALEMNGARWAVVRSIDDVEAAMRGWARPVRLLIEGVVE